MPKRGAVKQAPVQRPSWLARVGTFATVISSIVSVLFFALFLALFIPQILNRAGSVGANVAVISIEGVIMNGGGSSFGTSSLSSKDVVGLIEEADEKETIDAIIFEINSPGGTPVATEEIANAIKKTNKTTVAVIRDTGASGAYWVASATDHIIASRMSIVGSIGVTASYLDVSSLLNRYNVTYNRLVAGDFKDAGSPLKPLTNDERALFDRILKRTHDEFIDTVAANRKMPRADVEKLADGFVFLGVEAKDLGLVDELGDMDSAVAYVEERIGTTAKLTTYSKPPTFFEALTKATAGQAFYIGKGIGSALFDVKAQSGPSIWT